MYVLAEVRVDLRHLDERQQLMLMDRRTGATAYPGSGWWPSRRLDPRGRAVMGVDELDSGWSQVLRTRVGDADVMAGQLDRLLAVMSLPRVRIGIIPAAGERHSLTQGSFWMFDGLPGPHRDRLGQPDHHPAARYRALRPGFRAAPAIGAVRPRRPASHRPRAPRPSYPTRLIAGQLLSTSYRHARRTACCR